MKNIVLTTVIGVCLSACALLGPDYHKPEVSTMTNFRSQLGSSESVDILTKAWWKKFSDPLLNQLIESALVHNNDLQVAMGNILQAKASLSKVNMAWLPNISFGASAFTGQGFNPSFTNTSNNSLLNSMTQNNPQNFDGYVAGFIPSYNLNIFSLIKQGEIAQLNLAMQNQVFNLVRLTIISQVSASYFNLLGFHKDLVLQQALLADAQNMYKFTEIQYQLGATSNFNLAELKQFIASLKVSIPSIKNNITQSENALMGLTNQNPGEIKLGNASFDDISTENIIPINLPSVVLKSRPDVEIAEYQLKLANANIGAVTAQFFPRISLTGMLGQGSVQLSNLFNSGADFWTMALGAAVPVMNFGLYKDIDVAKAGYYSAYYNYIQVVRNAFSQVDNALAFNTNINQTYLEEQDSLNAANQLYTIGKIEYQVGAISHANTLGLKFNLDYNLKQLNQIKINQLNSMVNLYQALGGGYLAESQLMIIVRPKP